MQIFSRPRLASADLHVDAKYEGGRSGNSGDCPLTILLGVCNQGGFRYLGSKLEPKLIVMTTNLSDPEWPDRLDAENGIFTYFGDNKKPGCDLHGTPRYGNILLRDIFNSVHMGDRNNVPPILVFSNAGTWRDVVFRGLAVPGAVSLSQYEDLIAVWKLSGGHRFQNYRATFTVLDVSCVSRAWLLDIFQGKSACSDNAPKVWLNWIGTGKYQPLFATRSLKIRSKGEQIPSTPEDQNVLLKILEYFRDDPIRFEACAAEISRLALGNVISVDLTRPTKDGGRDAIGQFQVGYGPSSIKIEFSIEAKCYSLSNSVGVRELSRLISRIRHRQFGVLVTTSWVHRQAYNEIKEDDHPIVIISGCDIVNILKSHGIATLEEITTWLYSNFTK